MGKRISELFGMDIYSTAGFYRGKVFDLIVNIQEGKVTTITLESISGKLKVRAVKEAEEIMRSKSIAYDRVSAVGDIVLVAEASISAASAAKADPEPEPTKTSDPRRRLRLRRSI